MDKEQDVVAKMREIFPFPEGSIAVQRARRINAEFREGDFDDLFNRTVSAGEFTMLPAISGLDQGDCFAVIYHLAREDGIVLNLKRIVPKEKAEVRSVTRLFPCAELYERELVDMLGIAVNGLSAGRRYPLPEGWPEGQHPLRKDWNKESLDT
ncbi:MAG TPA: NADH-quinone oxidoreductase subunit C [Spirochaetota bacterium]|nr:NADH-quinone oxidoreductase subunit C [Spirochaetota bacterium]